MRAELAKATRSDGEFVRNVEKSKMVAGMEKKRRGRREEEAREAQAASTGEDETPSARGSEREAQRSFRQVPLARKRRDDEPSEDVTRVLNKIF